MQFPVDEFLSQWQSHKTVAYGKYVQTLFQFPYRLNWYSVRRHRKPEENWPIGVRLWERVCTSLEQNPPPPASPYDTSQIRDLLLSLPLPPSPLLATNNALPPDLSPHLLSNFSWFDGCAAIDAATYAHYAKHLWEWLNAQHPAHPSITRAATILFTYVLRTFYANPLLTVCRQFYAQLPPEEIIKMHLAEGLSGMAVLKITRAYTPQSTLEEIKSMIVAQSGGHWPKENDK